MNSTTRTIAIAIGTSVAIAASAFAGGHSGPPEVGARGGLMKNYAFNLGILGAMAKGEMEYDADIAAIASSNLAAVSGTDQSLLWKAGTDNGAIQGTRALPVIWSDAAGFKKASDDMAAAAAAMAGTSDLAGLQGAMGALGGACGACHKTFRAPNN